MIDRFDYCGSITIVNLIAVHAGAAARRDPLERGEEAPAAVPAVGQVQVRRGQLRQEHRLRGQGEELGSAPHQG